MGNKNTKQRLDELYDLLKSEYITESEFRTARANILRESGFDLSPASRARARTDADSDGRYARSQTQDGEGCGCGCFLFTLFLIAALAAGGLYFAPIVPDRFGGHYLQAAREEVLDLWHSFFPSQTSKPRPDFPPPTVSTDAAPEQPAASEDKDIASPDAQTALPEPAAVSSDVVLTSPDTTENKEASVSSEPASVPVATMADNAATTPLPSPELPSLPDSTLPAAPELNVLEASSGSVKVREGADVTVIEILKPGSADSSVTTVLMGSITVNSARIRSTPDASVRTNVVGWGRGGDRFFILEEGMDKEGAKWYRIRYEQDKKEGWISASLVKVEN